ncbi:hypothetical protein AB4298_13930 [Shewanella sp. 10N.261.52.F9]|uniref:hypothetical protein n=1 Tax=Shewanella sp. 10N.261.52.F9 TaxID=3229684 RepID=UPI00354B7B35
MMTILRKGYGKHTKRVQISTHEGQNVAFVSLGQRKKAIISVSDIDILSEHSFYAHKRNDGQYVARSSQTGQYLHRLIINPIEDQEVDHINADPLDNTRGNLRPCSTRQNNLAKVSEPVLGLTGIHCTKPQKIERFTQPDGLISREHHTKGIYKAISPDGKLNGKFKDPLEAAKARDELMIEEYFHRDSEEEKFHPYAFIKWNDESHFEIQEAITEMDDWLLEQREEAMMRSAEIMDENGWKGSL